MSHGSMSNNYVLVDFSNNSGTNCFDYRQHKQFVTESWFDGRDNRCSRFGTIAQDSSDQFSDAIPTIANNAYTIFGGTSQSRIFGETYQGSCQGWLYERV